MKKFKQKEYSFGFLRKLAVPTKDWLDRKLRQLGNIKLMNRFKSIFPKSYNYLRSLKTRIRL